MPCACTPFTMATVPLQRRQMISRDHDRARRFLRVLRTLRMFHRRPLSLEEQRAMIGTSKRTIVALQRG